MAEFRITDPGSLRRYRTELPNIFLDLLSDDSIPEKDRLKSFDCAVYSILKKTAGGQEGGVCYKATATIAREARVSPASVSRSKQKLLSLGLINITEKKRRTGRPEHHITITDLWELNFGYYEAEHECTPSQFIKKYAKKGLGGLKFKGRNRSFSEKQPDEDPSFSEKQPSFPQKQPSFSEKQRSFSQKPKKEPNRRINPSKKEPLEEERESSDDATNGPNPAPPGARSQAGSLSGSGNAGASVDPELVSELARWRGFDPDAGLELGDLEQLRQMARIIEADGVKPSAVEYARRLREAWFAKHHFAKGKEPGDPTRFPSNLKQMIKWHKKCLGTPAILKAPDEDPYEMHIER